MASAASFPSSTRSLNCRALILMCVSMALLLRNRSARGATDFRQLTGCSAHRAPGHDTQFTDALRFCHIDAHAYNGSCHKPASAPRLSVAGICGRVPQGFHTAPGRTERSTISLLLGSETALLLLFAGYVLWDAIVTRNSTGLRDLPLVGVALALGAHQLGGGFPGAHNPPSQRGSAASRKRAGEPD